jgi:DNA-binding NarL/FixJ family response regulator
MGPARKPTMVLAHDHRLVAEGLAMLLEGDFELLASVSSIDALTERCLALRPDVILTDVNLRGEDVVRTFADLRAGGCPSQAVFVTMNSDPMLIRRALDAGALGYVLKTVASGELRAALHAAADGRSFVCGLASLDLDQVLTPQSAKPQLQAQPFTARQQEVLRHLARGLSARDAGVQLGISQRTVEYHKYQMMQIAGVGSNTALVLWAIKHGIIESDVTVDPQMGPS